MQWSTRKNYKLHLQCTVLSLWIQFVWASPPTPHPPLWITSVYICLWEYWEICLDVEWKRIWECVRQKLPRNRNTLSTVRNSDFSAENDKQSNNLSSCALKERERVYMYDVSMLVLNFCWKITSRMLIHLLDTPNVVYYVYFKLFGLHWKSSVFCLLVFPSVWWSRSGDCNVWKNCDA